MMYRQRRSYNKKNKTQSRSKCLILLLAGSALIACSSPTQEEKIATFNARHAPKYELSPTFLMANWAGNAERNIAPLKLKIPVAYLNRVTDENGKIGILQNGLELNRTGRADTIWLGVRNNGEPATFNIDPKLFESDEIAQKKIQYWRASYIIVIGETLRLDDPVNKKELYIFGTPDDRMFRDRDVYGLENYKALICYSLDQLKAENTEQSRAQLKRLANKTRDDLTPANCDVNKLTQFWISPPDTPVDQAVAIQCIDFGMCKIRFLYKYHVVNIESREPPSKFIPHWKTYYTQVVQLLNSFAVK